MESNPVEESIVASISKHGFPSKAVQLPFRPVYDSCRHHGAALAGVLQSLRRRGIAGRVCGDHIVFRSADAAETPPEPGRDALFDPVLWPGFFGDGFSPEQMEDLRSCFEGLSDEDKKNAMDWFTRLFRPKER